MNSLLIYDSQFGNTQKIAQRIASSLKSCLCLPVLEASTQSLKNVELLIVGSPTQGGQATKGIQAFISSLPANSLRGVKVAAFDTRILANDLNFGLKLLINLIGYAAPKISKQLVTKGGELILPPEGFAVKEKEGPLLPGELERSSNWINF